MIPCLRISTAEKGDPTSRTRDKVHMANAEIDEISDDR